ncbi:hypothetical protein NPIL_228621 [Nephila pilipes]|uniref:Uncharacterized protein n=1 Tax=Nephila pilipes TaxID=299642 RepID=A0A8X6U4A2_NEPPI|nr:hypothetical protein NPIL_228621 [Nephila pilipes]
MRNGSFTTLPLLGLRFSSNPLLRRPVICDALPLFIGGLGGDEKKGEESLKITPCHVRRDAKRPVHHPNTKQLQESPIAFVLGVEFTVRKGVFFTLARKKWE